MAEDARERRAPDALTFSYTNWRGETAVRHVVPETIQYFHGSSPWHPEPQWLMRAVDATKNEVRDFAVKDIVFAAPVSQPLASDALEDMRARKDAAYEERNKVVAALATLFPSGTARTDIPGWSEDWHGCVYIDLPTGQVSWHYHNSQAHLFSDLPAYSGSWDGHDTDEKYRRLAALSSSSAAVAPTPVSPVRAGGEDNPTDEQLANRLKNIARHAEVSEDTDHWADDIRLAAARLEASSPPVEAAADLSTGAAEAEAWTWRLEGKTQWIASTRKPKASDGGDPIAEIEPLVRLSALRKAEERIKAWRGDAATWEIKLEQAEAALRSAETEASRWKDAYAAEIGQSNNLAHKLAALEAENRKVAEEQDEEFASYQRLECKYLDERAAREEAQQQAQSLASDLAGVTEEANNRIAALEARLAAVPPGRDGAGVRGKPVVKITGMDEYGPMLGWFRPWTDFPIGTQFAALAPSPDAVRLVAEDAEREGGDA